MKKLLISLLVSFSVIVSHANSVVFSFSAGSVSNYSLKKKMEYTISGLLTEIHRAGTSGVPLNLSGLDIESGAKNRLMAFWNNIPFVCEDDVNVSKCLNDHQGYQVRGIKIKMKPKDSTYDGSIHRELTVSINRAGIITGVRPAMELQEDVRTIMGEGHDVDDLTMRREILKWVEDFRNYYNERNLICLEQIYSDDALIITGSVIKQVVNRNNDFGIKVSSNVKYTVQSKSEYISKLRNIFVRNKYINVKFDKISVVKHGAKPNIYGVTLKQTWKTSGYSDEGWLFLVWDFNDPDSPQIHVRTWQPEQIVVKQGIFTLDDFFMP